MMTERKRLQLYLPTSLKNRLEQTATEIGLSQNHLAIIALHSLVKNFEVNGEKIFSNLITINESVGETKRLQLFVPSPLKEKLESMGKLTGFSQNLLAIKAIENLVDNFDFKGIEIFIGLLSLNEGASK